jgi:N4-gp56 family major capsid protein
MALNTNLTGTGGLSSAVATYYDKKFLEWLKADLMFDQFAQKKKMPKGAGTTIQFQRYTTFSANTTALTEGTVPSGLTLASTTITATPAQYGDYVALSDMIVLEAIDPIVESATELLAYRAALSLDTIIRNTLHGAVTDQHVNGHTGAAEVNIVAGDIMSASEVRKAIRTLKNNKVKAFSGGLYKSVFHPFQTYDLMSETATGGFLDITKYTSNDPMARGVIGKMWGLEIAESQNVQVVANAGSVNVYRGYVFGQNGYGIVDLEGMSLETVRKPLGSGGTSDPLNQIATVGYKFSHVTKVLDANRIVELHSSATQ